mmetsp:Transcript_32982/g.57968  ORF Transcript_32982/g.57968 Transcript_32982/m.57968 type:complete len:461 (-) Transcript_32982:2239-3621(-)
MALLLALLASAWAELVEVDGVLKLDDINFMDALETHDRVLVNFSDPACGHCKKLDLEYKKAALKLKELGSSVRLGLYEMTSDTHAATAYDIRAYPTLKFFVDKRPVSTSPATTAEAIVDWVNHRSLPSLKVISSLDALTEHLKANPLTFVVFASVDAKERVIVEKAAKEIEGISFVLCPDTSASSHFNLKSEKGIALINHSKVHEYKGQLSAGDITQFVKRYRLPAISEFTMELMDLIFEDALPSLVIFNVGELSNSFKEDLAEFSVHTELFIASADISKNFNRRLAEYLGVHKLQKAFAMILQGDHKWLHTKSITSESLTEFIEEWKNGSLTEFVKSQDEPSKEIEKGVRVLVSSTFDEVVKDPKKDVLVLYCVPWCSHCSSLLEPYQELAEHYADSHSVVIAKIDASTNDVEGVTSYPTVKLFPKDNKAGVTFDGGKKYEDLLDFVRSAGSKLNRDEL